MKRTTPFVLTTALLLTSVHAADGPLLDYRDHAFVTGSAFYSETERKKISDALKSAPADLVKDLGDDFAIMGDTDGAFTAHGSSERIFLVQKSAPVAIDPFPEGPPPLLVVLRGDEAAGFFRLPAGVQYQRLVAAADGNGDGKDEVLLETSFMNMGQSVTSLDVVELQNGNSAKPTQKLEEVYFDGCDNPSGERSRAAATVSVGTQGFTVEKHDVGCTD